MRIKLKKRKRNLDVPFRDRVMNVKSLSVILIVLVLGLSVGYSAYGTQLNIANLFVGIKEKTDIKITNVTYNVSSSDSHDVTSISTNHGNSHINVSFNLQNYSASVAYDIEITNFGNTELGIYQLTDVPDDLHCELSNYPEYSVLMDSDGASTLGASANIGLVCQYEDAYQGVTNDSYNYNNTFNTNIGLEFRPFYNVTYSGIPGSESLPSKVMEGTDLVATVSTSSTLNVVVKKDGITLKDDGNLSQACTYSNLNVGSQVVCGSESFHVVENDEGKIALLADANVSPNLVNTRQSEDAQSLYFASSPYWLRLGTIKREYGSLPAYIYNEKSNLSLYVESYKMYMETIGLQVSSAGLLSAEQANSFCGAPGSCYNGPDWLKSTNYWMGSTGVTTTHAGGVYNMYNSVYKTSASAALGLRPVINIQDPFYNNKIVVRDVNDDITIEASAAKMCTLVSGTEGEIGAEYDCNVDPVYDEDYTFYILSKTDTDVTLIANRNICNDGTAATAENKCLLAWDSSGSTANGPTTLLTYLEPLKTKWSNVSSANIDIPTYAQLYALNSSTKLTNTRWAWDYLGANSDHTIARVYGYWVKDSSSSSQGWSVRYDGALHGYTASNATAQGLRPIITLSNSDIFG